MFMVVSLVVRIVLNLYPFLRFDGYFVLSDALGMPNLQRRSFTILAATVPLVGQRYRILTQKFKERRLFMLGYGVIGLVSAIIFFGLAFRNGLRLGAFALPEHVAVVRAVLIVVFSVLIISGVGRFFYFLELARKYAIAEGEGRPQA